VSELDRERYRREKLARRERDVNHLRSLSTRLMRLLGLACEVAVGGTDCEPLVLLAVLERIDDGMHRVREPWSDERLVALLRETDPARFIGSSV
jgi:hypothetical protein